MIRFQSHVNVYVNVHLSLRDFKSHISDGFITWSHFFSRPYSHTTERQGFDCR